MKSINDMDKALRILIKLLTGFYCCSCHISNQQEEDARPPSLQPFHVQLLNQLNTGSLAHIEWQFKRSLAQIICLWLSVNHVFLAISYLTRHTIGKYSITKNVQLRSHTVVKDVARRKSHQSHSFHWSCPVVIELLMFNFSFFSGPTLLLGQKLTFKLKGLT